MSGDDRANKRDIDDAHAPTAVVTAIDTNSDASATPPLKRDSLPPVLATRYELKRVIGVGGMGLVYEALDLNLHRNVALKVLKLAPTKPEERADAVSRLVREARAMAALSHKNVVTVHDVGFHEDQVFVAMQLVEGSTMRQWLKAQKRSVYQILGVLCEAGNGLAAAHAARIIHRDFKPDNILVSKRDSVRVTDFGLARRSDGLIEPTGIAVDRVSAPGAVMDGDNVDVTSVTRSGAIVGTPAYMAPEQADGSPCDARADQFSFCVTAWESLAGDRPFAGKNWSEIYRSVQTQAFAPAATERSIPRAVQKALRRGLSVNPTERFPSMVELLDVLEEELRTPVRRRRIAFGVLAVAAVIIAVIVSRSVGREEEKKPAPLDVSMAPPPQTSTSMPPPAGMTSRDRMQHAIKPKHGSNAVDPPVPPTPPPVVDKTRTKPATPSVKVDPPPPKADPTPPTPPPAVEDPRLATLKTSRASLDGEYAKRELLASDLPADYVDAKRAMDDALTAKDADRAASELAKAQAAIAGVKIDREFVNRKVQNLNARIGKLPKERQAEFTARLGEVLSLFGNDQFVAANRKINEIVRALGAT